MAKAAPLALIEERRLWPVILSGWCVAAVLSAIQIYLRELGGASPPSWLAVLIANFLAWLPWVGIAPLVLALEQRYPLLGRSCWSNISRHIAASSVLSAAFLAYLSLFHLFYLDGYAFPVASGIVIDEYRQKLGQFFLTCVLLYTAILVGGLAHRLARSRTFDDRTGNDPAAAQRSACITSTFVIRSVGRVERVERDAVHWIEGCGNYARLHLETRSVLLRRTLSGLATELEPVGFLRVHKSAIVNLNRAVRLERRPHGEATLVLRNGQQLKVSRTYRQALERLSF